MDSIPAQNSTAPTTMDNHQDLSRRDFIRTCTLTTAALASSAVLGCHSVAGKSAAAKTGPATRALLLNQDWLFGGKFSEAATQPGFADAAFSPITLPHCVANLSWQKWDPASWQDVWIYRRPLNLPREFKNLRLFLEFEGAAVGAAPVFNGHALREHVGGFLPFKYEITNLATDQQNVLAVAIDGRWKDAPPEGSPKGPPAVDYYIPGGITRSVWLRAVPPVFISDVFAKPVAVLDPQRQVAVTCTIDAAVIPARPLRLKATLLDGARTVASASRALNLDHAGETQVALTLSDLGNISLWDIETPHLYQLVVTLLENDTLIHDYRTRIGFRDARFELGGFFLNGRRLQIFGLDRHELFPYVGGAMPRRVHRRDAEILRHEFHCNMVRCSHYPQSEAFLDACDELGLMIWEEIPGWQYIGGQAWQDLAVRDTQDMVRRDRNHPAIVIWGVRINESANHPEFYARTKQAAKALDDSRQTSGAMNRYSTKDWLQDVYAFDDYHSAPDGSVGVRDALPGVPYFLAEGVGQFDYGASKGGFSSKYRRAGELALQRKQALLHAQIHSRAAANSRIGGVIAWCAFDYGSPMNSFDGVKCPGVADVFRVPKLGAAFYLTQGAPEIRPVIEPDFYWDFGPNSPSGPGQNAAIFSNCDRLETFIDGQHFSSLTPDHSNYPNLKHPPFFAEFKSVRGGQPELRIDGYVGEKMVLSRSFCSDTSQDQLWLSADDGELIADGSDATRVVFRALDKFGAQRPFAQGEVRLELTGPGVIVGDNPFRWDTIGGIGAVWVKTLAKRAGRIKLTATHAKLGRKSVTILVHV